MKNFYKKMLLFLFIFLIMPSQIVFASFNFNNFEDTDNKINTIGDEVTININTRKKSNQTITTTEYFTPNNVTYSHNILATNANGETIYEEFDFSNNYTMVNTDRKVKYYDVNDGVYTEITRHNETLGTEQIKSLTFDFSYDTMTSQSNNSTWVGVWDGTLPYNNNDRLYFLYLKDDFWSFIVADKKKDNDVVRSDFLVKEDSISTGTSLITYRTYCRVVVKGTWELKIGEDGGLFTPSYHGAFYYPLYQIRVEKITQTFGTYYDEYNVASIKVKKGSNIKNINNSIDGYQFCGYYSDADYTTFYDFSKPLIDDTNIYLLYTESSSGDLSDKISGLNAGSTLNIFDSYRGGTDGDYDLYTDPSYSRSTGSIFIDGLTIKSGTTVNLTYGKNKIYEGTIDSPIDSGNLQNSRSNNDSYIHEEFDNSGDIGDNKCDINLLLNGDLTLSGVLNVGGLVGSYNGYSKYSFLIGEYAKLDLMGHDIIVDGGELNVFGVIVDSIGGGEIILKNNAKLKATTTIVDGKSIRQEILGLGKRQSPFTQYFMPYLRVPVYISNGCTFTAYCKFEMADFGIDNILLNLFGNANALFLRGDQDSSSYVYFEPYFIDSIPNSEATLIRQLYNLRNRFTINANIVETDTLNLALTASIGTIQIDVDFDFLRLDVPISSFFDLVINDGFSLTLKTTLYFYPGSSLYVKKNASITFSFKQNDYTSFPTIGRTVPVVGVGLEVPGENRYICGGIVNYTNRISDLASNGVSGFNYGLFNTTNYWKYIKFNNINIEGELIFDKRINTGVSTGDGFYILSGKMQLSDNSIKSIYENRTYLKTYSLKGELDRGLLFNSDSTDSSIQCEFAASYNVNCLTSNNISFYLDANKSLYGNFDNACGLFFKNGEITIENGEIKYNESQLADKKTYFFYTDTDMYQNGSSASNQKDAIDRNVIFKEVENYNLNTKVISTSEGYYVYFCGIYIPVLSDLSNNADLSFNNQDSLHANAQKFCSNYESPASNASKYNDLILSYNSSSKSWKFKSFEEDEQTSE